MKPICIVDACSFIYMHQFKFNVKSEEWTLFKCLEEVATIKWSRAVSAEISKHFVSPSIESLNRSNRTYKFKRISENSYEEKLFGKIYSFGEEDKGEIDNFGVAIDQFLDNKGNIVFITDDMKALNPQDGCLKEVLPAFPICQVWTSFDAILFFYLSKLKYFTLDLAKNAINDLVTFLFEIPRKQLMEKRNALSKDYTLDHYSKEKQELDNKVIRKKTDYYKRLHTISNII